MWTEIIAAPASANGPMYLSGSVIIRWTSSGTFATRLSDFDDRRADGDVGHEVAVHHVHVNQIGAAALDGGHGVAEVREVGRENRRREQDAHRLTSSEIGSPGVI